MNNFYNKQIFHYSICSNTQSNIFITRVDTILLITTTATLNVPHLITKLYVIIKYNDQ